MRRVAVWDEENQQTIQLLTNHPTWAASTIGRLYESRWQVEIFFQEIKELLHIKSFIGTNANAVMIQLRTALITILVLKVLREMAKYNWYLSNLVSFIHSNLFVKIELQQWLEINRSSKPIARQWKSSGGSTLAVKKIDLYSVLNLFYEQSENAWDAIDKIRKILLRFH